jgi:hypothetical protein
VGRKRKNKKQLRWKPGTHAVEKPRLPDGVEEWTFNTDTPHPRQPSEPPEPPPPKYVPGKCMRCSCELEKTLFNVVCDSCFDQDPRLNVYEMEVRNKWHDIDFLETIIETIRNPKWCWAYNWECKYLDVRIDMRDGGCIVKAKGKRITPDGLKWQRSEESPKRPIN